MRNFKQLKIWQKGMEVAHAMYELNFPREEKYGLRSQMTRAAVSMPSNIAEGCAKSTKRHFKQYLENAQGSAFELETQLLILHKTKMFSQEKTEKLLADVCEFQSMLSSFTQIIERDIA